MTDQGVRGDGNGGGEGAADADAFARAREAVAALRASRAGGRGPDGRFGVGNGAALKDGLRSDLLTTRHDAIEACVTENTAAILAHVGGADRAGVIKERLARDLARLWLLADSHWQALMDGGVTAKGKRRASEEHFHKARAAAERLSQVLGVEPVARPVANVSDYLAGKADPS